MEQALGHMGSESVANSTFVEPSSFSSKPASDGGSGSVQPGVLGLSLFQDGYVRVSIVPKPEELLVSGSGFGGVADQKDWVKSIQDSLPLGCGILPIKSQAGSERDFREKSTFVQERSNMRMTSIAGPVALSISLLPLHGQTTPQTQAADLKPNPGVKITFQGYVRDLACLVKFSEALKPINDCATMCVRAGSPLVVVTEKGTIYMPISDAIPDTSQRDKLMPFVGNFVEVTGVMFQRSGIKAVVINQIKKADRKP